MPSKSKKSAANSTKCVTLPFSSAPRNKRKPISMISASTVSTNYSVTPDSDSRSSTPLSTVSGSRCSRTTAHRGKVRESCISNVNVTPRSRSVKIVHRPGDFDFVYDGRDDDDEDGAPDYEVGHDNNSDEGLDDVLNDGSIDDSNSVWSDSSDFTSASEVSRLSFLPPRPKSPEFVDDAELPHLTLPNSSTDLAVDGESLMQALGIYEVLRHFSNVLRLSPFRFEDFCTALVSEEQSCLLVETHVNLLKSLWREDDGNNTTFGPQDTKDSVNITMYCVDAMTWYECVRCYLDSDLSIEFRNSLPALDKPSYMNTSLEERLLILHTLTNLFLSTNRVRALIVNEGNIQHDDHCRACHRLGDLLCCDMCTAVYHLSCLESPLKEVPEDEWLCSVCKIHQVKGVADCVSDMEKSGLLCRQEPIGYDRHRRKYWFLCRRIIVEGEDEVVYYSTKLALEELLDALDADVYEQDLVLTIRDMQTEIERQMQITLDLTQELKGLRKSVIEVENAALEKIQSERAARKAEEELERQKKEQEAQSLMLQDGECGELKSEGAGDMEDTKDIKSIDTVVDEKPAIAQDGSGDGIKMELDMDVTSIETETTVTTSETSVTNNVTNSVTTGHQQDAYSSSVKVATSGVITNGPLSQAGQIVSSVSNSMTPPAVSRSVIVVGSSGSFVVGPQNNSIVTSSAGTKTVMVVNKDGSKMYMVVGQPVTKPSNTTMSPLSTNKLMSAVDDKSLTPSALQESLNIPGSADRRIVTRSKTGSLTPKQFADSVVITTAMVKSTYKTTMSSQDDMVLVMNKNGDVTRVPRGRSTITSTTGSMSLAPQSIYYRLGMENTYRHYVNQYSVNGLALNKHAHNEERERRRHMAHKFSLTAASELVWSGAVHGVTAQLVPTLRNAMLALETGIAAPLLHPNWPLHRARWCKAVQVCMRPEDFALALTVFEACIKPVLFNQMWHEALGHTALRRMIALDDGKKKKVPTATLR